MDFAGSSCFYGPTSGLIGSVASGSEVEGLFVELNNRDESIAKARERNPYLTDRRPELYNL